ncbi:hypothetical protein B0T22DRAFT_250359 [Podospora appendiculata]|uniref:AT hook domain-containing protein n=2 Tax=Podospora appendiculata TaxID=314037 RepID=A0AAE1C8Z0_9PEZI|nr:hypothetical protein B0T22DRAFT_250359 [Podospora appendiculata]
MASRREILDSGDEESELSSANGDWDMEADADAPQPQDATTAARSTGSTDPSFFQRVYEEQEAAAAANLAASAVQSSATADQLLPSRNARRSTRGATNKDVVDLTTPGKKRAAPDADLWDVPGSSSPALAGSAARSQAKAQKTYGKRKRAGRQPTPEDGTSPGLQPHSASPNRSVHDPYDVPDDSDASPHLSNKKAKRGRKPTSTREARDTSPTVIAQTEESGGSAIRPRRGRGNASGTSNDSTIPDTLPSLYLAPSTLTASQKQEYRVVSLSSEPGHDGQESSMPPTQVQTTGLYKSSGATTIAYPTPTQFASSAQRGLPSVEMSEGVSTAVAEMPAEEHQQSSPDIISAISNSAKRRKTKIVTRRGLPSSEAEPPLLPQVVEETVPQYDVDGGDLQDDAQRSDNAELVKSLPVEPEPVAEDPIEMSSIALQEPAPKKKRGRKKKEVVVIEDDVSEDDQAELSHQTEEPLQPSVAPMEVEQPPKRGRGRPRKSDTPAVAAAHVEETISDTLAPENPGPTAATGGKKRGRKKKIVPAVVEDSDGEDEAVVEEVDDNHGDDEEDVKRKPLSKTSRNSQPPPTDTALIKRDDEAKENEQEQKVVKPVATPAKPLPGSLAGQTSSGKVQYRVGLSKRSRIAPLLKIMRK